MVSVSASVNLPLHHKDQKFSSGTCSPGWSWKKGRKTVLVVVVLHRENSNTPLYLLNYSCACAQKIQLSLQKWAKYDLRTNCSVNAWNPLPVIAVSDAGVGYWTTRGYANSRTGHLADWTTRGCHWRLCVLSFRSFGGICETASCPVRDLSSLRVD